MKRHMNLREPVKTCRFDSRSWAIELQIANIEVPILICEITLLLFGRATQLSLLSPGQRKLLLKASNGDSTVDGTVEQPIVVSLSRNDLECLIGYLITWYRDGSAEVDHIDVELKTSKAGGPDCTLVVKAAQSQASLSSKEAEKILRSLT